MSSRVPHTHLELFHEGIVVLVTECGQSILHSGLLLSHCHPLEGGEGGIGRGRRRGEGGGRGGGRKGWGRSEGDRSWGGGRDGKMWER